MTRDRGSASIWVLAAGLVVILVGLSSLTAGEAMIARHRAQVAADLGALAGAAQSLWGSACSAASAVVAANGATMERCSTDGLNVIVTAAVAVSLGRWSVGTARAIAKAGPAQTELGRKVSGQIGQNDIEDFDGVGLVQRFVPVTALRRLYARRTAELASARGDGVTRGTEPFPRHVVGALGESGAARMPVVDEHAWSLGVRVRRRR